MAQNTICPHHPDCKVRYEKGRGSFLGWNLKICTTHQIIISMRQPKSIRPRTVQH